MSQSKNKNCSELLQTNGMGLERAPNEILTFIFSPLEVRPPTKASKTKTQHLVQKNQNVFHPSLSPSSPNLMRLQKKKRANKAEIYIQMCVNVLWCTSDQVLLDIFLCLLAGVSVALMHRNILNKYQQTSSHAPRLTSPRAASQCRKFFKMKSFN